MPAASVVPQVPPDRVNVPNPAAGLVIATVRPVKVAPPAFDRVKVCAALAVGITVLKVSVVGDTDTIAKAGGWTSTAPGSICPSVVPVSGLALPKKSVLGTRLEFDSAVRVPTVTIGMKSMIVEPGVGA